MKLDVLLLPREALLRGHHELERLFVRRLPADTGMSRVACDAIRLAMKEDTAPLGGPALECERGEAIVSMVRLALFEQARMAKPLSPRWVLRDRIKEHVERRLSDPSLDTESIARALNCSKRALHKAFEAESCTLHQHIWAQRLEGAHGELGAAQPDGRSITEIAFAWGFSSPEHLSRVFRARYGASPRDWRLSRRPS